MTRKATILLCIGLIVIVLGLVISGVMLVTKLLNAQSAGVVIIGSILSGLAIANIEFIGKFKYRDLEIETVRKEVFDKADEVQKQKQLIDLLVSSVNNSKRDIENTSGEIKQVAIVLREATKKFIENHYYTLQTRNIFPIPQPIVSEIEKNLNILAAFAYPDTTERKEWVDKITQILEQGRGKRT